jgi:hypothetical protein
MSEFVNRSIGVRQHSYPETGGRGAILTSLARNYALGPGTDGPQAVATTGSGGTQIVWGSRDVPTPDTTQVPITPKVNGVILLTGVVELHNTTDTQTDVQVQIQLDTTTLTIPASAIVTVPPGNGSGGEGNISISFQIELVVLLTQHIVQILVTALEGSDGDVVMPTNSSTLNIQEVLPGTG